jgi:hypothetical protein
MSAALDHEPVSLPEARLRADGEAVIAACRTIVAVVPELVILCNTHRARRQRARFRDAVATLERLVGKP